MSAGKKLRKSAEINASSNSSCNTAQNINSSILSNTRFIGGDDASWWNNLSGRSKYERIFNASSDVLRDGTVAVTTSPFPNWWLHIDPKNTPRLQQQEENQSSSSFHSGVESEPASPQRNTVERTSNKRFHKINCNSQLEVLHSSSPTITENHTKVNENTKGNLSLNYPDDTEPEKKFLLKKDKNSAHCFHADFENNKNVSMDEENISSNNVQRQSVSFRNIEEEAIPDFNKNKMQLLEKRSSNLQYNSLVSDKLDGAQINLENPFCEKSNVQNANEQQVNERRKNTASKMSRRRIKKNFHRKTDFAAGIKSLISDESNKEVEQSSDNESALSRDIKVKHQDLCGNSSDSSFPSSSITSSKFQYLRVPKSHVNVFAQISTENNGNNSSFNSLPVNKRETSQLAIEQTDVRNQTFQTSHYELETASPVISHKSKRRKIQPFLSIKHILSPEKASNNDQHQSIISRNDISSSEEGGNISENVTTSMRKLIRKKHDALLNFDLKSNPILDPTNECVSNFQISSPGESQENLTTNEEDISIGYAKVIDKIKLNNVHSYSEEEGTVSLDKGDEVKCEPSFTVISEESNKQRNQLQCKTDQHLNNALKKSFNEVTKSTLNENHNPSYRKQRNKKSALIQDEVFPSVSYELSDVSMQDKSNRVRSYHERIEKLDNVKKDISRNNSSTCCPNLVSSVSSAIGSGNGIATSEHANGSNLTRPSMDSKNQKRQRNNSSKSSPNSVSSVSSASESSNSRATSEHANGSNLTRPSMDSKNQKRQRNNSSKCSPNSVGSVSSAIRSINGIATSENANASNLTRPSMDSKNQKHQSKKDKLKCKVIRKRRERSNSDEIDISNFLDKKLYQSLVEKRSQRQISVSVDKRTNEDIKYESSTNRDNATVANQDNASVQKQSRSNKEESKKAKSVELKAEKTYLDSRKNTSDAKENTPSVTNNKECNELATALDTIIPHRDTGILSGKEAENQRDKHIETIGSKESEELESGTSRKPLTRRNPEIFDSLLKSRDFSHNREKQETVLHKSKNNRDSKQINKLGPVDGTISRNVNPYSKYSLKNGINRIKTTAEDLNIFHSFGFDDEEFNNFFFKYRGQGVSKDNVKPVNKKKKNVNADLIFEGKMYKPTRVKGPYWVTNRLCEYIRKMLSNRIQGIVSKHVLEQEVSELIMLVNKTINYRKKGVNPHIDEVVKFLYKLGVVKTAMDYICFCMDYLPERYILKALRDPLKNNTDSGILGNKLLEDLNL